MTVDFRRPFIPGPWSKLPRPALGSKPPFAPMLERNPYTGKKLTTVQKFTPALLRIGDLLAMEEAVSFEHICRVIIGATPSQQSTLAKELRNASTPLAQALAVRRVFYVVKKWTLGDYFQQNQGVIEKS